MVNLKKSNTSNIKNKKNVKKKEENKDKLIEKSNKIENNEIIDIVENTAENNVENTAENNAENNVENNVTNIVEVVKKKRGRKPKIRDNTEPVVKIKKKRGRKPKVLTEEEKLAAQMVQPRRRGRKPKDKFKYEPTDFNEYKNIVNQDDNIIIKLPLSCLNSNYNNITQSSFNYDPNLNEPEPFNPEINNYQQILDDNNDNNIQNNTIQSNEIKISNNLTFNNSSKSTNINNNNVSSITKDNNFLIKKNDIIMNKNIDNNINNNIKNNIDNNIDNNIEIKDNTSQLRQIDILLNNKYNYNNKKIELLNELLINKNSRPQKTEILCFWCCCKFDNPPWGIPLKYENDKFELFGIFCNPQCTLAYLLNNSQNDDYLWEKISLLNLLYFKIYNKYENIVPALNKIALKQFGGSLDEEQYRNITSSNSKSYSIEFPPCNNVIPMLEEIYKKNNLSNSFIPIDKNRIIKANNELKLKRNKPINNNKNTLDTCMNIQF